MPDGTVVETIQIKAVAQTQSAESGVKRLAKAISGLNVSVSANTKITNKNTVNIRSNTSETDKNTKAHDKAAKSTKSHTNGLAKLYAALKRIAVYRALRGAIKAITNAFSEGVKRMYEWSKANDQVFMRVMDRYATEAQYMKDAIGAAVAPLLEILLPTIIKLVDKFVELVNIANQFFRALGGYDTWFKVERQEAQFIEDTEDAAAAQKALNDQLMDFDKLNIITTPKSSGRSQEEEGALDGNYVPIDPEIIDFVKHLPENIAKIAAAIAGLVGAFEGLKLLWDWLHNLGTDGITPKINTPTVDFGSDVLDDILDDFDWDSFWTRLKAELFKNLPGYIADMIRMIPGSKLVTIKLDKKEYNKFKKELKKDAELTIKTKINYDPYKKFLDRVKQRVADLNIKTKINYSSYKKFLERLAQRTGYLNIKTVINRKAYDNFLAEVEKTTAKLSVVITLGKYNYNLFLKELKNRIRSLTVTVKINKTNYTEFLKTVKNATPILTVLVRMNDLAFKNFKKELKNNLEVVVDVIPNIKDTQGGGSSGSGSKTPSADESMNETVNRLNQLITNFLLPQWIAEHPWLPLPYAEGGFPDAGSLFLAGEAGAEMVGTINGRTGVASGDEITGIADAVYGTGETEAMLLRQLIAAVRSQNLTISPSASLGKVVNQSQRLYAGVTG